ncbi:MAG: hypothetical protein ACTSW4_06470 [Candidatus Ranarchaeia archaeon]
MQDENNLEEIYYLFLNNLEYNGNVGAYPSIEMVMKKALEAIRNGATINDLEFARVHLRENQFQLSKIPKSVMSLMLGQLGKSRN